MKNSIRIGWASVEITPQRPFFLIGQMYYRVCRYVHDPLTATALALDNGSDQAVIVSCDMPGIGSELLRRLKEELDGYNGLDVSKITVGATHTHTSNTFLNDGLRDRFVAVVGEDKALAMEVPDNIIQGKELTDFWVVRVSQMIREAWDSRKPGGISFAHDYAAVAFNRRPVFRNSNGTEYSKMYGACSLDNFVRFEGPSDHSADMLYTWSPDGTLTGVMVNIPCPSQIMELHYFASADYWHYARKHIRAKLDSNVYILPICGAAGDQNPIDLIRVSKVNEKELIDWNAQAGEVWCNYDLGEECDATGERIADSVVRGFNRARNEIRPDLDLRHEVIEISLPLRTIEEKDYLDARRKIDDYLKQFSPKHRMTSEDQVSLFDLMGYIERWETQNKSKQFKFPCHVIRLGTAAFVTVPFELFVDYAFRVKAKCKADQVFFQQLSNSSGGYLPTVAAVKGGSYSSKPTSTNVGPEGGDKLSEILISEIDKVMK